MKVFTDDAEALRYMETHDITIHTRFKGGDNEHNDTRYYDVSTRKVWHSGTGESLSIALNDLFSKVVKQIEATIRSNEVEVEKLRALLPEE